MARRPVVRIARPVREPGSGEPLPKRCPALRVGLLGGSFNPAHEGHLAISVMALRRFRLHRVRWLVSPGNPLKPERGMASFRDRFASAGRVGRHPRIEVSNLEQRLGTRYTIDTVRHLQRNRHERQLWLMGADLLAEFQRWRRWREVFRAVPIAVFDREPYVYRALAGPAASVFGFGRRPDRAAPRLIEMVPPAWMFMRLRRHPVSSTAIREGRAAGEEMEERP